MIEFLHDQRICNYTFIIQVSISSKLLLFFYMLIQIDCRKNIGVYKWIEFNIYSTN